MEREEIIAALIDATPTDPDDGTVVIRYDGPGIPLTPVWSHPREVAERQLNAVEPLIRADERERNAQAVEAEADMDRHAYWTEDLTAAAQIIREADGGA